MVNYCCAGIAGGGIGTETEKGGRERKEGSEVKFIEFQRTLKIPVHYAITRNKLGYLDTLTARLTFAVRLWSDKINQNTLKSATGCSPFEHEIQNITGLSSGFVQQARDKALWMWKQYRESHNNWAYELRRAKIGTKWYKKLLKREPSEPCTSKRSNLKKNPTKFDSRTGILEQSHLALSPLVARISTLNKREKLTILLNPSKWHLSKLHDAAKTCGFELVKRGKKYFAHVLCKYVVHAQSVHTIRGVDLGVNREVASVKLPKQPRNFSLMRNGKRLRMHELDNRVAHLRRLRKWNVLKQIRTKRRHVAEDYDRKTAKEFAAGTKEEIVVIGDPQLIRYHKYKGNGDKRGRKILQHWSYGRLGNGILEKEKERGIIAVRYNEWGTSSECHKCGGKLKAKGRRVICTNCGMQYDREYNSCVRLLQKANTYLKGKTRKALKRSRKLAGAIDELARTIGDSGLEPWMRMEATQLVGW